MTEVIEVLTTDEAERLAELEGVIGRGLTSYIDVGLAAAEIRERRLYRATHETFEAYCRDRWDEGRNYVNKLIAAAEVVKQLGTNVPIAPRTEGQARELVAVPVAEREAVWQQVVETTPADKITAKVIRQTAQDMGVIAKPTPRISAADPGGLMPEHLAQLKMSAGIVELICNHDYTAERVRVLVEQAIEDALALR